MDWLPVVGVIALALGFAYTNGFHDSANAVATAVSTRALTPRAALVMAAVANFIGAFFGTRVAETVVSGLIEPPTGDDGLLLITAALVGAISWNVLTWWRGLPASSTHALIGGLVGAALVAGTSGVQWRNLLGHVLVPMILSPLVGFVFARVVMRLIHWVSQGVRRPGGASRVRVAQSVSAAAMAFGHGMQDASKAAGAITLALIAGGVGGSNEVPLWALALAALALSLGTYSGGWRIMRTLGRRICDLDPVRGLAAESSAAAVLYWATLAHMPISTTYTITGAIVGAGSTRGPRAVRWRVVCSILAAWVTTLPGAALTAALLMGFFRLVS